MDVSTTLSSPPSSSRVWLCRLLAAVLLLGSAGLRIAFMASDACLDLSPDEAHYWDWSRHPDWSYYSKGPVVAVLINASCALTEQWTQHLPGLAMLSVRLPAVLCGCLLLLSVYALTTLVFQRETWALGAVALGLTLPPITAVSEIMTIDAPFLCCWSWGLVFGYLALFRGKSWAWPVTGLMVAVGLLTKQTMILWIPSLVLFLVFTPAWRSILMRRGFWIMAFVAGLGGLPIIWWNFQHDWVNFRHLLGHGGFSEEKDGIHWLGPLKFAGTQFGLLMGYWFVVWAWAMWDRRPWIEQRDDFRFLWWMSVPTFLFFMAFGLKNDGGEPNWPASAYLSGMVLAVGWFVAQLNDARSWYRLITQTMLACIVALSLGLTIFVHYTSVAYPVLSWLAGPPTNSRPMPLRSLDPTCRLQGWRTLAAQVDHIRQEFRDRGEAEPIIAGDTWSMPGEVAFYCQGQPTVYSLGPIVGERHSQYDFWRPNPVADVEAFRGCDFIIIACPNPRLAKAFDSVEIHREVIHYVAGHPVNHWWILIGRNYRGAKTLDRSH
jgi:Dolichyl-phosphate-mannose-protein mannosyltransferase